MPVLDPRVEPKGMLRPPRGKRSGRGPWVPGSSPGMTVEEASRRSRGGALRPVRGSATMPLQSEPEHAHGHTDPIRQGFRRRALPGLRTAPAEIGRAHVCTPVTHAHLVCRLLLATKTKHVY